MLDSIESMNVSTPHATDDDDKSETMHNGEVGGEEMNLDTSPTGGDRAGLGPCRGRGAARKGVSAWSERVRDV